MCEQLYPLSQAEQMTLKHEDNQSLIHQAQQILDGGIACPMAAHYMQLRKLWQKSLIHNF